MKEEFNVEDKNITLIYNKDSNLNDIPVAILNTFDEDGQEIWNKTKELTNKEFILVTISNINWNKEMTPWYMDRLFKNEDNYEGKADEYIKVLTNSIIPSVTKFIKEKLNKNILEYILAGYSLAGLFSIYSMYKIDVFDKIISCSGSLWYPKFIDFVKENIIMKKPEKIYFSLGNKESKTRNELMCKVEENTKYLKEYFEKRGIKTIYEENEGNHFQDVSNRISKGICWVLE